MYILTKLLFRFYSNIQDQHPAVVQSPNFWPSVNLELRTNLTWNLELKTKIQVDKCSEKHVAGSALGC
jgi:hypothetical protein